MSRALNLTLLVASMAVVGIGQINSNQDVEGLFRPFRGMDKIEEHGDYGPLTDDLIQWIESRASVLFDRVQRFRDELEVATKETNRIVIEVLLLNTLADLEALINLKVKPFEWLGQKYDVLFGSNSDKSKVENEVNEYASKLILTNEYIEKRLRGKNNPGAEWSKNTAGLYRLYMEQRFSMNFHKNVENYLTGDLKGMKRATVFRQNPPKNMLAHGLYYEKAAAIVPGHFPFSSQDAIARGDMDV